mmetsp:Transcript_1952/g.4000  ORF Transcript_1952/g.4000 Transcript_1952/m.4000 type:complete len:217 (-) Transcript_1952:595-1245(-)
MIKARSAAFPPCGAAGRAICRGLGLPSPRPAAAFRSIDDLRGPPVVLTDLAQHSLDGRRLTDAERRGSAALPRRLGQLQAGGDVNIADPRRRFHEAAPAAALDDPPEKEASAEPVGRSGAGSSPRVMEDSDCSPLVPPGPVLNRLHQDVVAQPQRVPLRIGRADCRREEDIADPRRRFHEAVATVYVHQLARQNTRARQGRRCAIKTLDGLQHRVS